MKTKTEMIGAWATIRYIDENESLSRDVYFSFGQYDEATKSDTFGVRDEKIFFYATGESELKEMMEENLLRDFVVLGYRLVFERRNIRTTVDGE